MSGTIKYAPTTCGRGFRMIRNMINFIPYLAYAWGTLVFHLLMIALIIIKVHQIGYEDRFSVPFSVSDLTWLADYVVYVEMIRILSMEVVMAYYIMRAMFCDIRTRFSGTDHRLACDSVGGDEEGEGKRKGKAVEKTVGAMHEETGSFGDMRRLIMGGDYTRYFVFLFLCFTCFGAMWMGWV